VVGAADPARALGGVLHGRARASTSSAASTRPSTCSSKSAAREPLAESLDLLATIDAKSGAYAEAAKHYEALLGLPFDDQRTRLRWETQARTALAQLRRKLGDEAEARLAARRRRCASSTS
jgi:hypothetical protein